eukprot:4818952-Lingulodinium_polyedra.AAC.1
MYGGESKRPDIRKWPAVVLDAKTHVEHGGASRRSPFGRSRATRASSAAKPIGVCMWRDRSRR